jgi:hypothetical protein
MLFENSDDFKIIDNLLKAHPNSSTRDLRKHLKDNGLDWDKTKINSLLYKMLNANLVSKLIPDGTRPYWTSLSSGISIDSEHYEEAKKIILGDDLEKN